MCVLYRPPNSPVLFWDTLQEMLDEAKLDRIHDIIVLGDFNADDKTRDGDKFNLFVGINHLTSLINDPTRFTPTSQTKLDRIITNAPHIVSKSHVLDPLMSNDHCTIGMHLKFNMSKSSSYKRLMWDYNRADFDGLQDYLQGIDWSETLGDYDDIDYTASAWSTTILDIAKRFIPNRMVTVRHNDKPWYNSNLRRLKCRVSSCHTRAKTAQCANSWEEYRRMRNQYIQACRDAKSEHEAKRLSDISNCSFSTKQCWTLYKSVLGINSETSYPSLCVNDEVIVDDESKANTFNQLFAKNSSIDDTH